MWAAVRLITPLHKDDHVCFVDFRFWRGATREHPPKWGCDRGATKPEPKSDATLRAAVLFGPDVVARSLQTAEGYARRSRLVWAKNPSPQTWSYLWNGVLRQYSDGVGFPSRLAVAIQQEQARLRWRDLFSAGTGEYAQDARTARRHAPVRQADAHKPRLVRRVGHPFDGVGFVPGEIIVECKDREVEARVGRQADGCQRRGQYNVGRIQVGIGEEKRIQIAGGEIEHVDYVLARGAEIPQFAVEHVEIRYSVAIGVDEHVKLRRVIRMRPFAVGVDRELNPKIAAADVNQTCSDGFQINDRKVVAGAGKPF